VHPLSESSHDNARFGETAWSVVLAAGNASEPRASEALAELCRNYWPPVYGFLRRRGYNRDDGQDLTQSFFQHLMQDHTLRRASPDRGRFRSFLLGALKRFVADEKAHLGAIKRGGGVRFVSTEELAGEEMYHERITAELTPAESLDARWATVLLDRALGKVRAEFTAQGKAETFDALAIFLSGDKPDISYREAAQRMGIALAAVKSHIHRLRRQFASAVREEVMQTVSAPHEVDDELRQLCGVFARLGQQQTF
jgi:DNA-directed RNA polymerase specialized sigma24 family protein